MNAYIYCADLLCPDCAIVTMNHLRHEGKAPEDWKDENSFDSDDYPKGPYPDGGGESDSPCHCGACGVPLENPLTSDGILYVLSAIQESLEEAVDKGRALTWDRIMPLKGTGEEDQTWLHGKRHVEIVRSWAESLSDYSLEKDESAIVGLFLELSEAKK